MLSAFGGAPLQMGHMRIKGTHANMLNSFVEKFNQDGEVYLRIKVRPGARADEVKKVLADEAGEIVKIDIAAPAVRGKANLALMKFLAREFGADKSGVSIISGAGERLKLVKIVK